MIVKNRKLKIVFVAVLIVVALCGAAAVGFLLYVSPPKDDVGDFDYPSEFFCKTEENHIDFQTDGRILCGLILPIQRVLFGKNCNPSAVKGLSRADTPALVLQGSEDREVIPDGCALYARRGELTDFPVTFRLIEDEDGNGHMTVIRKKGSRTVNEETMRYVETFLDEIS